MKRPSFLTVLSTLILVYSPLTLSAKTRSMEWKNLPKQSWEIVPPPPENPEPLKDLNSKDRIKHKAPLGFNSDYFPSSDELEPLGQIIASTADSEGIDLNNLVFISASNKLNIDTEYAITQTPTTLKAPRSGRKGYSYLILGKVKILFLKDRLYMGRITNAKDLIPRGSFLIPLPPKIIHLKPLPGPRPIVASLLIDHHDSTFSTAQNKEVYIDQGSVDGVTPGMVFRVFDHFDPATKKKVSDADLAITGDIVISQVSSKISTGIVFHCRTALKDYDRAVLLTDISDLKQYPDFSKLMGPNDEDLDALDDGKKIQDIEKRKLKQMKSWTSNPPSPSPLLSPSPSPTTETITKERVSPTSNESQEHEASPSPMPQPSEASLPAPALAPTPPPAPLHDSSPESSTDLINLHLPDPEEHPEPQEPPKSPEPKAESDTPLPPPVVENVTGHLAEPPSQIPGVETLNPLAPTPSPETMREPSSVSPSVPAEPIQPIEPAPMPLPSGHLIPFVPQQDKPLDPNIPAN